MKRRIVWSCRPKPYGFHILATAPVCGKPLDINVALSGEIWTSAISKVEVLAEIKAKVEITFDAIESYVPPGATRH